MAAKRFKTVDQYIASLSRHARSRCSEMRRAITQAAPSAREVISYNMPAYKLNGMLVYFCAHAHHIGLYPFRSAIHKFRSQLKSYHTGPGTVRFPMDKRIPVSLVRSMVKFRVKENREKLAGKKR